MNILVIGSPFYPQIGGVGTVIFSVTKELVKMGHTCVVLTEKRNSTIQYEHINGIYVFRYKRIKFLYGLNPLIIPYLKNIIKIFHIDIVHIHGYHSLLSLECAILLKIMKVPFIFSPHYHGIGHTSINNMLFKFYGYIGKNIFQLAKQIVCVSAYEENIIRFDFNISSKKIKIIPNGVDNIKMESYKKILNSIGLLKLLYIGRLERYKGVQYIIELMSILKNKYGLKVNLTIVGRGPFSKNLLVLSKKLGVLNNIVWYDTVTTDKLNELYRTHDFLLLLSQAEAYGLVVAEALTRGTPCIVVKKAALSEFINEPGCFGIDYPINVERLAELIIELLHYKEITVGPFSYKIRTWSQVAKMYEELYSKTN